MGSGPDEWLLDQAAQGLLTDDATLPGAVDQMLQDDRVKRGVEAFVDDWLLLDELDQLNKDPGTYPHFSREFGEEAREETHRLFEHWCSRKRRYSGVYDANDVCEPPACVHVRRPAGAPRASG